MILTTQQQADIITALGEAVEAVDTKLHEILRRDGGVLAREDRERYKDLVALLNRLRHLRRDLKNDARESRKDAVRLHRKGHSALRWNKWDNP